MPGNSTDIQLLLIFLAGAFASTCIHHLISYLARRKKPLRFVFFLWIIMLSSAGVRFYILFKGDIATTQSFVLQILELGVACCMVAHLAYNEAARYIKYILPSIILAFVFYIFFPNALVIILGSTQLASYGLMGYLGYQLYLLKKPFFNLLILTPLTFIIGISLFGIGPFGLANYYPMPARALLLGCYLITIIFHAVYLNRMSALTSKKFVENEFITKKLKEVDQLKSKFFSSITHEFRTPLTLIQGPIDELLERTKETESQQLLNLVKVNSNRLLKLINQLLDLARLDAQQMKLNPRDINLNDFFLSHFSQFNSMALIRKITFECAVTEDLPSAMVDDEKLETILSNLIANALKFTAEKGEVNVLVAVENRKLKVQVSDSGRGIPQKKLEHIFDRFYQVEPSDSSHSEGTGIGLALVKEYVELMNGLIYVESELGKGTQFHIEIPIIISEIKVPINKPSPSLSLSLAVNHDLHLDIDKPLLLLTDDNEQIRLFIKTCLGKNFRYSEAPHGRDGLEVALEQIPDLIISDLMMPEMDGIEFCKRAKNDRRTDHIPFIMLTAKAGKENKLEGLLSGADDYLIKPFNKAELLAKVNNLITLRKNLQINLRHSLIAQATRVEATSAEEQFIWKAKNYVENNIANEQLSVESLANEMNLSREQCYRKLMALTSLSPSAFIRKLKLQKAAQFLKAKSGTVSQIAYEVGFENLSHFSKTFKDEFGTLPSEYKG